MASTRRRYLVVLEATSAARVLPGGLTITEEGDGYSFSIQIMTVYEDVNLDTPMPRDLRVVAEIEHQADLETTSAMAGGWTNGFLNVLAVATNASIDDGLILYSVERTEPTAASEFYQARNTRVPRQSVGTRAVPADAALGLFRSIHGAPETVKARLVRACQNYVLALRYWRPDSEALSLVHLAIAGETLRDVARDRILNGRNLTKSQLAESLKTQGVSVPGTRRPTDGSLIKFWVMTQLIYHGDSECYESVDEASNGFEHGYGDFNDIKVAAHRYRDRAAQHIRQAIIEQSSVDEPLKAELLESAFLDPMVLWSAFAVRGHVTDSRPEEMRAVPPLHTLEQVVHSASYNASTGKYELKVGANVTCGPGVSVTVDRFDARP